ncbi:MAG: hypothetical protein IT366_10045 [Candidatus Hydrogenedentes bacterium]|nr:hypothetical protein [Candidatus Hydrogenedentota bacterium]
MENSSRNNIFMCTLAAIVMAYGWGYRGVVGHEGGAMVPGAMLGLAVCIASRRADWQRRAAVAGLFGAVGWSWGGSLSYMEHTMFAVSDSFPDVLFGYAMLFFCGALWAGIGGAILGLAFTLKRSQLKSFARVFVTMCAAFLTVYLYFFFNEPVKEAYEQITVDHFHDGEWLAALIVLVVSIVHGVARKKDRHAAFLFFLCALAWWNFYLLFTKFGGLVLAPPFRSESWAGVLGILFVLVVYLGRTKNSAALMLCRYGIIGGGLAFMLAVFVRHPVRVSWGPFSTIGSQLPQWLISGEAWKLTSIGSQLPQWKIAEESFGLFMGIAIAIGISRLERGNLAPAEDDTPRKPLDIFAAFVMLVALMWVNLRRAPMDWLHRYKVVTNEPFFGLMPWHWFTLGGAVITAVVLYALWLYSRDRLVIAPASAHGKAALILVLLIWITMIGSFGQTFAGGSGAENYLVNGSFIVLGAIATAMTLRKPILHDPSHNLISMSDPTWRVGPRFGVMCAISVAALFGVTGLSMAMQDGPVEGARLRFGPNAYWIEQSAMIGRWRVMGLTSSIASNQTDTSDIDVTYIEFLKSRNVVLTLRDGTEVRQLHRWHYMNSMTHLDWNDLSKDSATHHEVAIVLREGMMFIPWPPAGPGGKYLMLIPGWKAWEG